MEFIIYHNPQWGKSRKSLELLRSKNIDPIIIEYLKNPLSITELKSLSRKLTASPKEFVRKNDSRYKELNINEASITDDKMFEFISQNPRIMERPIITCGEKAVIGRPPENILELL